MWIYIVLYMLFFLTTLCDVSEKTKRYNLFILYSWVIIFTLFRGLRWCTGTDWAQYQACFDRAQWNSIFTYYRYGLYTEVMEYGYVFLNVLIKTIFGHYTFFLLITNLAILLNFAYFSKKYVPKYPLLTFGLLVVYNPVFPVRQDIAMVLLFWACHFAICKRYLLSMLFVFFASTIHDMSVIFFPLIFLFSINFNLVYLGLIAVFFFLFANVNTLFDLLERLGGVSLGAVSEMSALYLENVTSEPSKMSIVRYIYVAGFVVMFKYYANVRGKVKENLYLRLQSLSSSNKVATLLKDYQMKQRALNFYTNAYLCMFFVYVLAGLGGPFVGFGRMAHFFYPSFPIAFMIVYSMEYTKKYRNVLLGVYVVFFLYQFFKFQITDLFGLYDIYLNPYYSVFESVPRSRIETW